ncbi:MAG: LysR family transcriptional regulator [Rhodospirillales bacterium]|nr:LysR family transcriptional regulator [Rhodospirillales bacterium]
MPRSSKTPQIRLLIGAATALGPGKVELLEAIARTGSISAAARAMGMSYRRAWVLVEGINQSFRRPLVVTATGGKGGGGAQVTEEGLDVLGRYRAMEAKAARAIAPELADLAAFLTEIEDSR